MKHNQWDYSGQPKKNPEANRHKSNINLVLRISSIKKTRVPLVHTNEVVHGYYLKSL